MNTRGNTMKKYITAIVSVVVATLALTACSGAASKASALTTPKGFEEISTSGGAFEFSSLVGGNNNVDFDTVCNDLFDWAEENGFTRYTLVENTFELVDYTTQGRPISKNREDDAPWVSGCGGNIVRLEEEGPNASMPGPNKNRIAAFFGVFDEGSMKGYAFLNVEFNEGKKYLSLKGEFLGTDEEETSELPSPVPNES